MSTIKAVFDRQFADVKFDRQLCTRIIRFSQEFMTRNSDHSAFFGGVLLGVNPIRFFDSDREAWYEDVLDIDEELLEADFRNVKSINFEFNVMSDVFNYTPSYICYRLDKETTIPQSLRHSAKVHAFMVLHYRFLTSLLVRRFKYPADQQVAQATYNELSGRFDIKRYGSWRALLEARAEDLISTSSIYRTALKDFAPDATLIRVVTDTQGRIRELVKKIYAVYLDTLERGSRVTSTSDIFLDGDGELILRDKQNSYRKYLRYIEDIVAKESTFIKPELTDVIASAVPTMPPKLLNDTLRFLSSNYGQARMRYLDDILKESLLYTFSFMHENRATMRGRLDLPFLLPRLKSLLTAARSSDASVLALRKNTEKLVKSSIRSTNNAVVASVRTGVILYIVLRALTRDHYS